VLNEEGLRFPDEPCRHKILDLMGDLALIGRPLVGKVVGERAGHAMHAALVSRIMQEPGLYELVNFEEATKPQAAAPPVRQRIAV
jgi:UDP-3-O-[3-hydroxymyristoyl] N-acetylglucosamine deacetylase